MLTGTLLRIPFSVISRCILAADLSLDAGVHGFLSGLPPFDAFLIIIYGGKCLFIKIKFKRRTKGKQKDNVACRNLKSKKTIGGSKIRW
jgi:hypothetical protein